MNRPKFVRRASAAAIVALVAAPLAVAQFAKPEDAIDYSLFQTRYEPGAA